MCEYAKLWRKDTSALKEASKYMRSGIVDQPIDAIIAISHTPLAYHGYALAPLAVLEAAVLVRMDTT